MAKVNYVKASKKEYVCSKCGKTIPVGSPYYWGKMFRRRTPIRRCVSCRLNHYELSSSSYVQSVAPIVEEWEKLYGVEDGVWDSIAGDLQGVLDEVEESLENIPYQLQDGDVGTLLQERKEQLESVISELDFDMENFLSEALGCLEEEEREVIYAAQGKKTLKETYEEFADKEKDTSGDYAFAHWREETESVIAEYVGEVLGELSY